MMARWVSKRARKRCLLHCVICCAAMISFAFRFFFLCCALAIWRDMRSGAAVENTFVNSPRSPFFWMNREIPSIHSKLEASGLNDSFFSLLHLLSLHSILLTPPSREAKRNYFPHSLAFYVKLFFFFSRLCLLVVVYAKQFSLLFGSESVSEISFFMYFYSLLSMPLKRAGKTKMNANFQSRWLCVLWFSGPARQARVLLDVPSGDSCNRRQTKCGSVNQISNRGETDFAPLHIC